MTARWLNVLAGVWVAIAPFWIGYRSPPAFWNDIACGIGVVVLAFIAMSREGEPVRFAIVAIGLWLAIAPWALVVSRAAQGNDLLLGLLIFLSGLVANVYLREREPEPGPPLPPPIGPAPPGVEGEPRPHLGTV